MDLGTIKIQINETQKDTAPLYMKTHMDLNTLSQKAPGSVFHCTVLLTFQDCCIYDMIL